MTTEIDPVSPGGGVPTGTAMFELLTKKKKRTVNKTLGLVSVDGGGGTMTLKPKKVLARRSRSFTAATRTSRRARWPRRAFTFAHEQLPPRSLEPVLSQLLVQVLVRKSSPALTWYLELSHTTTDAFDGGRGCRHSGRLCSPSQGESSWTNPLNCG